MTNLKVLCTSCGNEKSGDFNTNGQHIEKGELVKINEDCGACEAKGAVQYKIVEVLKDKEEDLQVKLDVRCNNCNKIFRNATVPVNLIDRKFHIFNFPKCPSCKTNNPKFVILEKVLAKCRKCRTALEIEVDKGAIDEDEKAVSHYCKKCERDTSWDISRKYTKNADCGKCFMSHNSFVIPLKDIVREQVVESFPLIEFNYGCPTCRKITLWANAHFLTGKCLKCGAINQDMLIIKSFIDIKNKSFTHNYGCSSCHSSTQFKIVPKGSKEESAKKKDEPEMVRVIGCYNCKDSYPIENLNISDSTKKVLYEKKLGFGKDKKVAWFPCPFCDKKTNAIIYEKKKE
jgi:hypothetical protein